MPAGDVGETVDLAVDRHELEIGGLNLLRRSRLWLVSVCSVEQAVQRPPVPALFAVSRRAEVGEMQRWYVGRLAGAEKALVGGEQRRLERFCRRGISGVVGAHLIAEHPDAA